MVIFPCVGGSPPLEAILDLVFFFLPKLRDEFYFFPRVSVCLLPIFMHLLSGTAWNSPPAVPLLPALSREEGRCSLQPTPSSRDPLFDPLKFSLSLDLFFTIYERTSCSVFGSSSSGFSHDRIYPFFSAPPVMRCSFRRRVFS